MTRTILLLFTFLLLGWQSGFCLDLQTAKTQGLVGKLAELKAGKRPLLVVEDASENLYLAARNIPYVEVRDVQGLDPVSLVASDTVVMTADAVKKIEEWLA